MEFGNPHNDRRHSILNKNSLNPGSVIQMEHEKGKISYRMSKADVYLFYIYDTSTRYNHITILSFYISRDVFRSTIETDHPSTLAYEKDHHFAV